MKRQSKLAMVDKPVRVKLSDEDLIERARTLAAKVANVTTLRTAKTIAAKNAQLAIDEELDEIGRLSRVILDDEEDRKQGDIRFEDQAVAVETLAKVAVVAETKVVPDSAGSFVCEWCTSDGKTEKQSTYRRQYGMYEDDEKRKVCPSCMAKARDDGYAEGIATIVPEPAAPETQHERISKLDGGTPADIPEPEPEEDPPTFRNPYETPEKITEGEEPVAEPGLDGFGGGAGSGPEVDE